MGTSSGSFDRQEAQHLAEANDQEGIAGQEGRGHYKSPGRCTPRTSSAGPSMYVPKFSDPKHLRSNQEDPSAHKYAGHGNLSEINGEAARTVQGPRVLRQPWRQRTPTESPQICNFAGQPLSATEGDLCCSNCSASTAGPSEGVTALPGCQHHPTQWSRRPFGAVANTAAAPCWNRRPPTSTARTDNQKEATIPTDNEPTGSHCQSNSDQHLDGPPLGAKPQDRRLSPGRAQARRLLETASDELVRLAVKASTMGLAGMAVYWFERR